VVIENQRDVLALLQYYIENSKRLPEKFLLENDGEKEQDFNWRQDWGQA